MNPTTQFNTYDRIPETSNFLWSMHSDLFELVMHGNRRFDEMSEEQIIRMLYDESATRSRQAATSERRMIIYATC